MTLEQIKTLLVTADPNIRHYFSMQTGDAYSYWEETRRLGMTANNRHNGGWRFYVHRYTKTENDATAQAIFNALDADPRTTVIWTNGGYDQESGYIHHIFECEG